MRQTKNNRGRGIFWLLVIGILLYFWKKANPDTRSANVISLENKIDDQAVIDILKNSPSIISELNAQLGNTGGTGTGGTGTGGNGTPLSSKIQPFFKTGTTQATTADDILDTDAVIHTGALNIGANEATMPFDPKYKLQVSGGINNKGQLNSESVFNQDTNFTLTRNYVAVYVDWVGGTDGLKNDAYYGATISTGNKFKTLEAAVDWVNINQRSAITICVQNTSDVNKLTLTRRLWIWNKLEVSIIGVGTQYIDFGNYDLAFYGTIGAIGNMVIDVIKSNSLLVNSHGELKLFSTLVNVGAQVWLTFSQAPINYAGQIAFVLHRPDEQLGALPHPNNQFVGSIKYMVTDQNEVIIL
jgi:hypothetical protein